MKITTDLSLVLSPFLLLLPPFLFYIQFSNLISRLIALFSFFIISPKWWKWDPFLPLTDHSHTANVACYTYDIFCAFLVARRRVSTVRFKILKKTSAIFVGMKLFSSSNFTLRMNRYHLVFGCVYFLLHSLVVLK